MVAYQIIVIVDYFLFFSIKKRRNKKIENLNRAAPHEFCVKRCCHRSNLHEMLLI